MSKNMPSSDIRTFGYVLKRTNYGEADRILNIITPNGKKTAIAKGVRKTKSKLAGGVEIFSLVDFVIHTGRNDFGIITSAKMIAHYSEILKDFDRIELAGTILKTISQLSENSDSPDFFNIVDQCLRGLNNETNLLLLESWFLLNAARAMGEEMNLYRDENGHKLQADKRYDFDKAKNVFTEKTDGIYGAEEIKMLRFMALAELDTAKRVRANENLLQKDLSLIKIATRWRF